MSSSAGHDLMLRATGTINHEVDDTHSHVKCFIAIINILQIYYSIY